ncbi:MAG: hypothetical protein IJK67_00425, partial [Bacilli bacterium]|nr:hypothetical protein [Bacilli bacterium]
MYNSMDDIGSTTVSQFKATNNGYILAIVSQELFIFSSDGIHQVNTSIAFINKKYPCLIIPIKNIDNSYYFTLIYAYSSDNQETCSNIIFKKGTFDSNSKTISFDEPVSFDPTEYIGGTGETIYATISCDIMKNNSQEYISCIYGNTNYFIVSIFDIENYQEIAHQRNTMGGQFFKQAILPDERESAILCSYKSGLTLACLSYYITTNSFSEKTELLSNLCSNNPSSLIMEYFYELEQFIIGCQGYSTSFYIANANEELTFTSINGEYTTTLNNPDNSNNRINLVLPSGQSGLCLFNQGSGLSIISDFSVNIIQTYPVEEIVTETSLTCEYYYNYKRTGCEETIPEGYYCNSTEDKTIDKCHQNCKTCEQKGTDDVNNCLTCKEEGSVIYTKI